LAWPGLGWRYRPGRCLEWAGSVSSCATPRSAPSSAMDAVWDAWPVSPPGWPDQFYVYPWPEIVRRFHEYADLMPDISYMADIVDSVLSRQATALLAGHTSMTALIVTTQPIAAGPPAKLIVTRPSRRGPISETVLIEYESISGQRDLVTGPSSDAVPLFWRVIAQRFNVQLPPPTMASEQ
jgi:hypothetical protein